MKKRLDYKWVIVVLCFLMVMTTLGLCSSNKSLFLAPITEALNIERSAYAIGDSCRFVATVIVNMFFASLIKRFGTKKLIIAGFLSLIISSVLYAVGTTLIELYIAGALLGVGLSWTTTTMVGWVVGMWCKKNKGTIMGAVLAANGVGGALAAQLLSPIIYDESTKFGYRNAYLLVAAMLFAVCLLILIFFKEKPHQCEEVEEASTEKATVGFEYSAIKRMPQFYVLIACTFLNGVIFQGTSSVAVVHLKDVGFDSTFIAAIASFGTLVMTISKMFSGYLYDKKGLRVATVCCNLAAIIAIPLLIISNVSAMGKIIVVVYAFIIQFALPLDTVMIPICISDLFGEKAYAKMLGTIVSVGSMGAALGTTLVNFGYDVFKTYVPMFAICLALAVAVTVMMQIVILQMYKKKKD